MSNNISFFIPAFNCKETIKETLESIYDSNIIDGDEVVVADDASTDGTYELLLNLKEQYNFKLIKNKSNKGGGATRNFAIENTTNELLFCLDSDNLLSYGSIQNIRNRINKDQAEAIAFNRISFFKRSPSNITHEWIYKNSKYNILDYFSSNKHPGSSGNYLFTKKSWQMAGGYPADIGALDTWGFGLRQLITGTLLFTESGNYFHRYGHESYFKRYSNEKKIIRDSQRFLELYSDAFPSEVRKFVDDPNWYNIVASGKSPLTDIGGYGGVQKYISFIHYINEQIRNNVLKLKNIMAK
jgi:glycosyltransferase involved in cell wall biosynthesis